MENDEKKSAPGMGPNGYFPMPGSLEAIKARARMKEREDAEAAEIKAWRRARGIPEDLREIWPE